MLVLGIDTSAVVSTCAVCEIGDTEKVIASGLINTKLTHSQTLVPFMESLLKSVNIKLSDIDAFAVSSGPGSFTGLRIGISAIKGIAFALDKKCISVSTLLGIAYNFRAYDGIVCACMDARCNQVYNALFRVTGGKIERLCEDRAMFINELADDLRQYDGEKTMLAGDGAELAYKTINGENIRLAPADLRFQKGTGVCFAAECCEQIPPKELMPVYLRLPQAERERIAREKENEK